MVSVNVAVWESEPELPVSVMVLVPAAADADAVRVIACDAPGATVTDTGAAVTPAGKPETAIATEELKLLMAVTVTMTCWVTPPAFKAILVGATEREKSPLALDCLVQLVTLQATQLRRSSQRWKTRRLFVFSKVCPSTCMPVLLPLRWNYLKSNIR